MPKEYTQIRDSIVKRGKPLWTAKRIAAALWNKRHPDNPNPWNKEKKRNRRKKR